LARRWRRWPASRARAPFSGEPAPGSG